MFVDWCSQWHYVVNLELHFENLQVWREIERNSIA